MEAPMFQPRKNAEFTHDLNNLNNLRVSVWNHVPRTDWSEMSESEHFVQFYETDLFLLNSLGGFISAGLQAGDACIVVATKAHRDGLDARLQAYGLDASDATARGQYILLDAAETLAMFMVDGSPDPARFREVLGGIITRAAEISPRVRIFGEMVALLWSEDNHAGAIRLEELWNDLHKTRSFSLFCAYPMHGIGGAALALPLGGVCAAHSRVIPSESYTELAGPDERLRAIVELQQKAKTLEAEVAERKELEGRLRISEICYRRHFEAARDGLLIVDPETHKITEANPSIIELLGTHEELVGKELWETGLLEDREASLAAFRELDKSSIVRYDELPIRTKDGQKRYVEFVGNIYATNGHRVIQFNVRDITERRRADEIATKLAAIVESSDDAIVSKSLEGIILTWNRGAERIFGYSAEEVVGKPIQILIPPERIDEEPVILQKVRSGERLEHYESVRVAKDGRRIHVSLTVSPIRDRNGKVIGASKIARNITERKRAEEEREQLLAREQAARAEAESANRTKDEFLATVSHELRTPLNAIMGWSHLLRRGRMDEAATARAAETIERNAKAQAQLIEDILDVSRVIAGKLRLNVGPVDLASVINAAIESVQLAADSKGIHMKVTLDPSARHISGDSGRLQQVVWNLLSNAIKFTQSGGHVEVRLEHAKSNARIKVSDTGQGISKEFLPFIFDRFRQADGTSTRRHSGLGLGLALVQHLVELHGGTVRAESPGEGGGATFTIALPIVIDQERAISQRRETGSLRTYEQAQADLKPFPSLNGVQVLLVDDDRDNLQILTVMLKQQGADVQSVATAAEALEVLQWHQPDVMVSDLAMPGEDGYSLIDKVRALEAKGGRHIPALALTAYVRVEDRARALSAGFNMFVAKPVEPSELIAAIANLSEAGAAGFAGG
jgi:PAS domain S-box-containing protein